MKTILKIVALIYLSLLSSVASAQQPPVDQASLLEYLKGVQAQMLNMHQLSNRILAETDPVRQQELKNQQLEIMRTQYLQMMSQQQQRPGN